MATSVDIDKTYQRIKNELDDAIDGEPVVVGPARGAHAPGGIPTDTGEAGASSAGIQGIRVQIPRQSTEVSGCR